MRPSRPGPPCRRRRAPGHRATSPAPAGRRRCRRPRPGARAPGLGSPGQASPRQAAREPSSGHVQKPSPPKVKVAPVAPETVTPQAVAPAGLDPGPRLRGDDHPEHPGESVTVWYIRHGENPANLTGELSCRTVDYPLTGHGVEQATALAGLLSRE